MCAWSGATSQLAAQLTHRQGVRTSLRNVVMTLRDQSAETGLLSTRAAEMLNPSVDEAKRTTRLA
jgi:hypothetical protein